MHLRCGRKIPGRQVADGPQLEEKGPTSSRVRTLRSVCLLLFVANELDARHITAASTSTKTLTNPQLVDTMQTYLIV